MKQKVGESAGSNDLDSSTLLPTVDQWEVYALLFLKRYFFVFVEYFRLYAGV